MWHLIHSNAAAPEPGVNELDILIKEIIHPNLITQLRKKGKYCIRLVLSVFRQLGECAEVTNTTKAPSVSRTGAKGTRSPGSTPSAFNRLSVTSV